MSAAASATAAPAPVVSDSRLLPLLKQPATCLLDPHAALGEPIAVSAAHMAEVVAQWRGQVAAGAKNLVKATRSVLEELASGGLYERLGDPRWKTAALVCEVFRRPDLTKNAGWLATRQLQRSIVEALDRDGPLTFSIAWGQAKRGVGGLKVLGPLPDLAEFCALGRLAMMSEAVARHLDGSRAVRLEILGGATRYHEALFTRDAIARAYDQHRAGISTALQDSAVISVQPFVLSPAVEAVAPGAVDDLAISANLATVTLNVDWGRFFRPTEAQRREADAGRVPAVPAIVGDWLDTHDDAAASRLLRAAVTTTVNPRCQADWEAVVPAGEMDVLRAAVEFVRLTARRSTRQYLRLHALGTPGDRIDPDSVRLTVHEKKSRQDIPAIYTLGPQSGDQLPQHVVAKIGNKGTLRFGPFVEFAQTGPVRPVMVEPAPAAASAPGALHWLAEARQPLCVTDAAVGQMPELLARALRF